MVKNIPISQKAFLLSLVLPSLILLFSFSVPVQAIEDDDVVDISKLPNKLAEALNMPLFAGQILASAIPFALICFPTFLLTHETIAHITAIVLCLSLTVAFGWLPYWILIALAFILAFLYADKISAKISHRGSD